MKIFAICASPRKQWNDDQLLTEFKKGFLSIVPDAEIETVYLYDLNYTGCRSCFGCKLLTLQDIQCVVKDDIHDILYNLRHSDGFVYASPIYFSDVNGQLKCFFERLMYPGPVDNPIPIEAIYTMNANQEKLDAHIKPSLTIVEKSLGHNFKCEVESTYVLTTWQRDHNELYKPSTHSNIEQKMAYRKEHWPIDLQNAYNAGVRLANKCLSK